jgi:alpha-tubulin suppressor-like RCC1 family protein
VGSSKLTAIVLVACAALSLWLPGSAMATGVFSWGSGAEGALGGGTTPIAQPLPSLLGGATEVASLAASGTNSFEILTGGGVLASGTNRFGQLADGLSAGPETCVPAETQLTGQPSVPCSTTPAEIPGLSEVTAIAAGERHDLALLSDGHVKSWGRNIVGQLGTGSSGPETCPEGTTAVDCSRTPLDVSGLTEAVEVATGSNFSLALLSNGHVMAWGENGLGQLGQGSQTGPETCGSSWSCSRVPREVSGLSGVTAVAAGQGFAIALLANGHVMKWGASIGDLPVEEAGLSGVSAIAVSWNTAMFLLANGTVVESERLVGNEPPRSVKGLSGVSAIAPGAGYVLAKLTSGELATWGRGEKGQLGGAIEEFRETAARVCGLSGVAAFAAGSAPYATHALAYVPGALPSTPTIIKVTPSNGAPGGGEAIDINGRNLAGVTSVHWGATEVPFSVLSDTAIRVTSPAGSGSLDVTVSGPEGTSTTCAGDTFHYVERPVLSKISPKEGPAGGGTVVRIRGATLPPGYNEDVGVLFGSVAAARLYQDRREELEAVTPPEPAGIVPVRLTGAGGSATTINFKFLPTIGSETPNHGPAAGGTKVTFKGTGFLPGTKATVIRFGSVRAAVNCPSSTECVAVAPANPAGATTVKLTVNKVSATTQYTYE